MVTTGSKPRLVLYGSLSKDSKDPDQESIESQISNERARADREYPAGYTLLRDGAQDFFSDDGYSGSKRDRGPGLERAIRAAVEAASDGSGAPVELWVNTPARLARGSGKKDEARSILELFVHMQREGVTLRSVNDDDHVRREEFVGFASRMAAKYAEDLSESVKRANLRKLAAGERLGGPLPDGYRVIRQHDDQGRVIGRTYELDPERSPTWRAIFDLAEQGVSDAEVARRMNATGARTKNGLPFDTRAIRNGVTNAWYSGRIVHRRGKADEQVVPGRHPALIEPAAFDAIKAARRPRQLAPGSDRTNKGGRPAENHALAGLARCACGAPMHAKTSRYWRHDGSRGRSYVCRAAMLGECDAPRIDAETVDTAIIDHLDTLLIDFDGWRSRIESGHVAERERMTREVERAERDREAQADRTARVDAKWSGYVAEDDDAKADLVLPMVKRERDALASAELRLTATKDALASVPDDAPADAMLDFANALREAVRGRLDASRTMAQVRASLADLFESFELRVAPWAGREPHGAVVFDGGERGAVWIQPVLHAGVALRLYESVRAAWPLPAERNDEGDAPPLRWLATMPSGTPDHVPSADLTETCTDGAGVACDRTRTGEDAAWRDAGAG